MNHRDFDAYSVKVSELIQYDEDEISSFFLYSYEYIDNLNFLLAAEVLIEDSRRSKRICKTVESRFREEGWTGTGRLGLLWLPPFSLPFTTSQSTEGMLVWHVKQHEDGISWMLSPKALPFPEFQD